jgi:hypothetical protein
VFEQYDGRLTPRKPQTQGVAQSYDEIVPTGIDRHTRQMRQIRVLLPQKPLDQRHIDVDLSRRPSNHDSSPFDSGPLRRRVDIPSSHSPPGGRLAHEDEKEPIGSRRPESLVYQSRLSL